MSYYLFQGAVQGAGGFGPGLDDEEQRRRRRHHQSAAAPYSGETVQTRREREGTERAQQFKDREVQQAAAEEIPREARPFAGLGLGAGAGTQPGMPQRHFDTPYDGPQAG